MAQYVDGYVLPIPKKKLPEYRRMAKLAGKVWRDHGALEYRECVIEDPRAPGLVSFPTQMRAKRGEVVVFAYVVFKSRAHRDRVNAKVMKDPRLAQFCDQPMPFDVRRMVYGGFVAIV